jgi:hypothetical protein
MDFEEENIYTMHCGGGGDSDSGDNGGVTGGGDEDRSGGGYSEAEAQAAGVDTSQDDSFDSDEDTAFTAPTTPVLTAPQTPVLTSPETPVLTAPETPSLSRNFDLESNLGLSESDVNPAMAEFGDIDPGDSLSGGDPNISATSIDAIRAAPEIYKQKSLGEKVLLTGLSAAFAFPVGLTVSALQSYSQSRDGIQRVSDSGLLSDSTFDSGSDAADNNTFVTRGLLQNPNTSPAVQFLANVRQSTVMDRYNAAKERLNSSSVAVTPFGRLAVSASPFYNFLEQRNLNRGIL